MDNLCQRILQYVGISAVVGVMTISGAGYAPATPTQEYTGITSSNTVSIGTADHGYPALIGRRFVRFYEWGVRRYFVFFRNCSSPEIVSTIQKSRAERLAIKVKAKKTLETRVLEAYGCPEAVKVR